MIFKTFNNDIDKASAKIGILGKSFYEFADIVKKRKSDIESIIRDEHLSPTKARQRVGSLWSNLLPSQESVRAQIIDVDSLIPKMDTATA